ncbi:MAG: 7-cyano-7-deazaguanine synthase QueC [Woeseiaceae bacterium]|jgi:7-cyano-7-deazaguanine synthase|nr:7-cyano-7-deazaguanine synthase QueC [Woeseiaceae bacterium]
MTSRASVVVLSGGQDSTTCLYWAMERFGSGNVRAISFDYGQRHRIELESASAVAALAGVPHTVLPIDTFAALGGNALTAGDIPVGDMPEDGLPNTFVPGRNLIFITFAAAYACRYDINDIVTGVAQTDYSGYPDCRDETLRALERAVSLGMEREFSVHTPLMFLSKKETVELAVRLGAMEAMALTHTCYEGRRPPCGSCPACRLRAKGFAEAGVRDPLLDVR